MAMIHLACTWKPTGKRESSDRRLYEARLNDRQLVVRGRGELSQDAGTGKICHRTSERTPEVSPVGFEFDGKYFRVGSHSQDSFSTTRRYKNITGGDNRVSIVVDDLASVNPWRPREVKISGIAEIKEHDGIFGAGKYIRIGPTVSVSWNRAAEGKGADVCKAVETIEDE